MLEVCIIKTKVTTRELKQYIISKWISNGIWKLIQMNKKAGYLESTH